jgi:orotidine-5'-phosphate decarboxylase
MPSAFTERLRLAIDEHGPLCLGIDPSPKLLADWGLPDDAEGAEHLARTAIEAVNDVVGVTKIQVAFFERHGAMGYAALERVLFDAFTAGLVVIGDAKRGDIASTNAGYADAWLRDESALAVDALTCSAYLGVDALGCVFELAHRTGRGVFVVVASSNDEGRPLQTALHDDGRSVEATLLSELGARNAALDASLDEPVTCIGAVVGAQRRPPGLSTFSGPVLVPGMGAQGADADDLAGLRAALSHDLYVVAVSRGILTAGPSLLALRSAAEDFSAQLA